METTIVSVEQYHELPSDILERAFQEKEKLPLCHVCKKEKKPYTVIMKDDIFSLIHYEQAREKGEICERCNRYFAMTQEFKDASEEEFIAAKKAVWFANMMQKWWEKDRKLKYSDDEELNFRSWEGTHEIAKWCRKELNKKR